MRSVEPQLILVVQYDLQVMELLRRKRDVLTRQLKEYEELANNVDLDKTGGYELETRISRLDETFDEFKRNQDEILLQCETDETEPEIRLTVETETKFCVTKSKFLESLDCLRGGNSEETLNPNPSFNQAFIQNSSVRLPQLNLPEFGGDYHEWLSFHDLFRTTIHENDNISDAQKLQYLKGCLKGSAAAVITNLSITNTNFEVAWDLLVKRYENKHIISQAHLKRIFDCPVLNSPSISGIRDLIDTIRQSVQALEALGLPTNQWDTIVLYLLTSKLDNETRREWELSFHTDEFPKLLDCYQFMEKRCQALETSKPARSQEVSRGHDRYENRIHPYKRHVRSNNATLYNCFVCKGGHSIYRCNKFQNLSVDDRLKICRQKNRCLNCLKFGHRSRDCRGGLCLKCSAKHHTLLHRGSLTTTRSVNKIAVNEEVKKAHVTLDKREDCETLLPTALVKVNTKNKSTIVRALLDSGSQASFVTERLVSLLNLNRIRDTTAVTGIGSERISKSRGRSILELESTEDGDCIMIDAIILKKVTGTIPNRNVKVEANMEKFKLADPSYGKPGRIDVLIGADNLTMVNKGSIKQLTCRLSAQETIFGWTFMGVVKATKKTTGHCYTAAVMNPTIEIFDLKKFWEIEDLNGDRMLTKNEVRCENHFAATHYRQDNGRFEVRYPFSNDQPKIGESYSTAKSRWNQMERRLKKDPELEEQYTKFMNEYESLGHMSKLAEAEENNGYFIPHHAVRKESSTTTKLRVVFDASAMTTNGSSLNNEMLVGPKLQDDIQPLLIRFRCPKIAFTGDIQKMYRQILIHPDDCKYQKILWREDTDHHLKTYELKTVTYGTAAAPYIATKCLQQLAEYEKSEFPVAAKLTKRDFYMDDLMSGVNSDEEAIEAYEQLHTRMKRGGFELRKWASNSQKLLDRIPLALRETQVKLTFQEDEAVKTLGLFWHPAEDYFSFTIQRDGRNITTKREILSEISKIFDPLGLLGPVIVPGKILLQKIWSQSISWDSELPTDLLKIWNSFYQELKSIENLKIPRVVAGVEPKIIELHGFCDASEAAYGAVIYMKSINKNKSCDVSLITSKTRVAPLKKLSIPRLELCSAVLLSKLMKLVKTAIKIPVARIAAWSDSTVTLAWINGDPNRWKTFVANRVTEIQESIEPNCWQHVKSKENPADCSSRGLKPTELFENVLWWKGPTWLRNLGLDFERKEFHTELERKKMKVVINIATETTSIFEKFSCFNRLVRVVAYCLRFGRARKSERKTGHLTVEELRISEQAILRNIQQKEFSKDYAELEKTGKLGARSKLLSLNAFMDENGLIRVGGRLQSSGWSHEEKHPIVILKYNWVTKLIVRGEHERLLHANQQLLMSSLRKNFWILGLRDVTRQCIHSCVKCYRFRAKGREQLMGSLPEARLKGERAFLRTGVDYAGPLTIKSWTGRGSRSHKCYVALFVCLATRAIHLELVSDLTTGAFLAALKRFLARRGRILELHSDCGTNFIGATAELRKMLQEALLDKREEIQQEIMNEGIDWKFIPPGSPHFGGIWEAGVKSMKYHLRRIVGNQALTFEDLSTVLTQIVAVLNSRPLSPLTNMPDDLHVLTPGHFLIGESPTAVPKPTYTSIPINRLKRWQFLQSLVQNFWIRWKSEYVSALQQRPKWKGETTNVKPGDLVLLKDENLPPLKWLLGRVMETFCGSDGLVRVVTLKTKHGQLRQTIVKICKLPFDCVDA